MQTHADSLSGPVSNPLVLSPPHATLLDLASFPLLSTGKVHLKGDLHEMMSSFLLPKRAQESVSSPVEGQGWVPGRRHQCGPRIVAALPGTLWQPQTARAQSAGLQGSVC